MTHSCSLRLQHTLSTFAKFVNAEEVATALALQQLMSMKMDTAAVMAVGGVLLSICELHLQLSVCCGFLTHAVSPPLYFFQKMHHFPKPRFSLKNALSEYGSAHKKYRC